MVRKGGNSRSSAKRPTGSSTVGPALPQIGQPALMYPSSSGSSHQNNHVVGNGLVSSTGKTSVVLVASPSGSVDADEDRCPQCSIRYNSSNNRKVTESCGHSKCRSCVIMSEDGCTDCNPTLKGSTTAQPAVEPSSFIQYPPHQNSRKGLTIVDVTGSSGSGGNQHLTRRAAAAHRLQSATNSRTNSSNSGRPTSSSPQSSLSNDTGRQTSSVYSDSADSDSCLRFSSSISGGVENDGYAATIDFEAMAELTSPNLEPAYISISDYTSTDSKSYTSILNEDTEFSKSLMNLRKLQEPSIQNSNHSRASPTSSNLIPSSEGSSATIPSTSSARNSGPTGVKRRARDSSQLDSSNDVPSKFSAGGGSPDITQVPRDIPLPSTSFRHAFSPEKVNSSAESNTEGGSSITTSPRLGALLTRNRSNKEGDNSIGSDPLAPSTATEPALEEPVAHSSESSIHPVASSSRRFKPTSPLEVVKEEEEFVTENDDDDSKDGEDDEDDDDQGKDDGDGDGPTPKKKKKRSPVVIHDHITVLGGDPQMYQCNVCQKKFKTKAHIKYHEFCQKGDKPFKCEQCGQGFIAKSHYEYHLRTHTGERPYVCPKCGKGFNQRGKVTRHMRSHTGEKPFICPECNRGFANAQALRSHTLIHTGERPFACTYCNKRFTGMTNLKKHVITHTGERPFSCNHCGKSFGLKWTLDLHLRTHSSERPYACDQCSRAFSNSKDLRRHLVIHSGERPFKCWICGTAFRRKDNLDRHIKNTHNQPKEIAKQLANEAAAEYLKQTTKNQSLGNIPVSKVNSVVISNIIKNADLMPAGGIVPNNLHNKSKQIRKPDIKPPVPLMSPKASNSTPVINSATPSTSTSITLPKTTSSVGTTTPIPTKSPKASISPATGATPSTSSSTTLPKSVQKSSPVAARRKVLPPPPVPLSPPTTRASRSKETEKNKTQRVDPISKIGKSPKQAESPKVKPVSQTTPTSKPKKAPIARLVKKETTTPIVKEETPVVHNNVIEIKEKKKKSKRKKAKKNKAKKQERMPPPPSPPISVIINTKSLSTSATELEGGKSEDLLATSETESDRREEKPIFFDIDRTPTLTLVTIHSPKAEDVGEAQSDMDCLVPDFKPPPPVQEGATTVEVIIPDDIEDAADALSNVSDSSELFLVGQDETAVHNSTDTPTHTNNQGRDFEVPSPSPPEEGEICEDNDNTEQKPINSLKEVDNNDSSRLEHASAHDDDMECDDNDDQQLQIDESFDTQMQSRVDESIIDIREESNPDNTVPPSSSTLVELSEKIPDGHVEIVDSTTIFEAANIETKPVNADVNNDSLLENCSEVEENEKSENFEVKSPLLAGSPLAEPEAITLSCLESLPECSSEGGHESQLTLLSEISILVDKNVDETHTQVELHPPSSPRVIEALTTKSPCPTTPDEVNEESKDIVTTPEILDCIKEEGSISAVAPLNSVDTTPTLELITNHSPKAENVEDAENVEEVDTDGNCSIPDFNPPHPIQKDTQKTVEMTVPDEVEDVADNLSIVSDTSEIFVMGQDEIITKDTNTSRDSTSEEQFCAAPSPSLPEEGEICEATDMDEEDVNDNDDADNSEYAPCLEHYGTQEEDEEGDDDDEHRLQIDESFDSQTHNITDVAIEETPEDSKRDEKDSHLSTSVASFEKLDEEPEVLATDVGANNETTTDTNVDLENDVSDTNCATSSATILEGDEFPAVKSPSLSNLICVAPEPINKSGLKLLPGFSPDDIDKSEGTLPADISDFVLLVMENKCDDLESISSGSLASPHSDVENSIKMCIQTLESDEEEDDKTDFCPSAEERLQLGSQDRIHHDEQNAKLEKEKFKRDEEERLKEEEQARSIRVEEERIKRAEAQRIRQEEQERQKIEEEKRREIEARLKRDEEERLKRADEERLKREEEAIRLKRAEEERLKREEEQRLNRAEEERLKREEEQRLKRAEEERLKREAEQRLKRAEEERLKREVEQRLKRAVEERLKREEEAIRLKRAEEERLKREEDERLKRAEAERLKREEEARLKRAEEERLKREKEAQLKRAEEERLKREEEARLKRAEEERLKLEEEARLKRAEEERLKREEEARLKRAEEERLKREEEALLKRAEEERLKREEEARLKREEEERLKREEEVRLKLEEEERLKREEETRLKREEEERLKREEEAQLKRAEEERLKLEEEDRLKRAEEQRLKLEEKARLKRADEERLKREEDERLKQEGVERLKREEAARLKREEDERLKLEGEARLKREEELRVKQEEVSRLKREEDERIKRGEETRLKLDEEERSKREEEERTAKKEEKNRCEREEQERHKRDEIDRIHREDELRKKQQEELRVSIEHDRQTKEENVPIGNQETADKISKREKVNHTHSKDSMLDTMGNQQSFQSETFQMYRERKPKAVKPSKRPREASTNITDLVANQTDQRLRKGVQEVPTRVQFVLPHNTERRSLSTAVETASLPDSTMSSNNSNTQMAYDPSMIYLGEPVNQQPIEGGYQLVYAAAAATAEREEGVNDGPPNKVRLLYAEALGVGSDTQNGNELQFYYTSTTPDQQHNIQQTVPYELQLMDPYRVTYTQGSNQPGSDTLQYYVQGPEQQYIADPQQQQQVLNLSVTGNNPVYYYTLDSNVHGGQSTPQSAPGGLTQQLHPSQLDHDNYCASPVGTPVTCNNVYSEQGLGQIYTGHNTQSEVTDFGIINSARHLEFPVYTAHCNQVSYAQAASADQQQNNGYLNKVREIQHVFPQGSLRHCSQAIGSYDTSISQPSSCKYGYNGMMSASNCSGSRGPTENHINGTGQGSVAFSSSNSDHAAPTSRNGQPLTGLELLSAATEKVNSLQFHTVASERAALAIAAVGQLARMRRLESKNNHQIPGRSPQPQQPGRPRSQVQPTTSHQQERPDTPSQQVVMKESQANMGIIKRERSEASKRLTGDAPYASTDITSIVATFNSIRPSSVPTVEQPNMQAGVTGYSNEIQTNSHQPVQQRAVTGYDLQNNSIHCSFPVSQQPNADYNVLPQTDDPMRPSGINRGPRKNYLHRSGVYQD